MFWLAFLDTIAIFAIAVQFGVILLEGAVYCSNPVMTLGVGIVGYWVWLTASSCCLVLAVNRLFDLLNLSKYFSSTRTSIYIGLCCAYGLFMTIFTRPVIVNSTYQSMFFSPFIPGHSTQEYENVPHAVHNIVIAISSFLLYLTLCLVLLIKSKSMTPTNSRARVVHNMPVFLQSVLIGGINFVAALMYILLIFSYYLFFFNLLILQYFRYVYMNFLPAPPVVILIGHICWQLCHGLPPFIYLALNKSIRQYALKSVGLDRLLCKKTIQTTVTARGSSTSHQPTTKF